MACGKSSGRPDAPLSHLATGRPPRCALLPIGDSRALVPHPVSPLPPQPSLYRRRAGGWPARRLRFAIARMRRRACRSRGRSTGVCATAVLLATLGRRCAVARLALQPMRASRQRAGVACTSRRALHPRLRRPSRPPFPWRAVPVRAPEPYPDRTQAGAARGSEAGAIADGSQQARAGGACTSRRALYPHVRRRSRPPLPWLALPERPALSQTATVRFLPPQARVVLVSRRGARVARCGIAQPRDRRVDGVCSRWACVYGPGCNTLGIGDWYRGGLWRVGVA